MLLQKLNKIIHFRYYFTVFNVYMKQFLSSPSKFIGNAVMMFFRIFILIFLYKTAFEYKGNINGVTIVETGWALMLYFVVLSSRARRVFDLIQEDVETGVVEVKLLSPRSYLFSKIFENLGSAVPTTAMLLFIGGILTYLLVGIPTITFKSFIFWFILFIFGLIVYTVVFSIVGLFSFYLNNSKPVYFIVDKMFMILGGGFVPVILFPDWLKKISIYSPFGAGMTSTQVSTHDFNSMFLNYFSSQIFWIIVSILIIFYMWQQIRKVISINGG